MGQPITWRNVEAPDLRGAASMLQLAGNGINSGFDKFNQVLQNEQATADANWKQQRDNNTQAFLNSINQYRTPEEYQAALTSGALNTDKYGAQIDQAAVRAAMDGRLSILQDRTLKANQFADQIQAREAQPIVDRLNTLALSDDKQVRQSAKEALGIYAQNGMVPEASKIAGNIRNVEHQNVTWDQEAAKAADELKTNQARRALMADQGAAARANAEASRASTSDERAALKARLAAAEAQNTAAALKIKNGPLDQGDLGSTAGKEKFIEGLKSRGVRPDEMDNILKSFSEKYSSGLLVGYEDAEGKKPVRIPVPVSYALAAVDAAGKDWAARPNWLIGSNRGGRSTSKLEDLMADPTYRDQLQEAMQARGIQYRPLTSSDSAPSSVSVSVSSKTKTPPRLGLPKADSNELDTSGVEVLNRAIKSRTELAQEMMTPAEIEAAKSGKLPSRIKRYLEAANPR